MRWFDEPPCPFLEVKVDSPARLVLAGPVAGERLKGGATAAFGGVFAGAGLAFLRLPIPGPFKLVPLAFAAVGSGLAALGAGAALARASVEVTAEGLTWRWKVPGRDERTLAVAAPEVHALEVTTRAHEVSSEFGGGSHLVHEHQLVVITKGGQALPLEAFGTRAQAELRKAAVLARLGR